MLLEGGLRWQAMALTPAEMDFAGLKEAAAREIALAFGVPPVLLGLPGDATYANYREANRALWNQGILPLARRAARFRAALKPGVRRLIGPRPTMANHPLVILNLFQDNTRRWCVIPKQVRDDENWIVQ